MIDDQAQMIKPGTSDLSSYRWLKSVVVSAEEKAHKDASGGDREGERKLIADEVPII